MHQVLTEEVRPVATRLRERVKDECIQVRHVDLWSEGGGIAAWQIVSGSWGASGRVQDLSSVHYEREVADKRRRAKQFEIDQGEIRRKIANPFDLCIYPSNKLAPDRLVEMKYSSQRQNEISLPHPYDFLIPRRPNASCPLRVSRRKARCFFEPSSTSIFLLYQCRHSLSYDCFL
jgi:hypothetical protein